MTKSKLRQAISKAADGFIVCIPDGVTGWGFKVYMRSPSSTFRAEHSTYSEKCRECNDYRLYNEHLLVRMLCDEEGSLLYDYSKEEDLEELGEKNPEVLSKLYDIAEHLAGYTDLAQDEIKKKLLEMGATEIDSV